MDIQQDFKELFALFNEHKVEYLVVGSYALALHGAPRYTGDIDVWVRPHPDNAQRILSALRDFGFDSLDLTVEDFSKPDNIVQLGVPPVRIDLMTSISGVSWDAVARDKVPGLFGDVPIHYIGRASYILNKRAAGRMKDLADLEALGE